MADTPRPRWWPLFALAFSALVVLPGPPTAACEPEECDDSNTCTIDTCDPELGCVHTPVPDPPNNVPCDGPPGTCGGNGWCIGGQCVGNFWGCDDGNPCTLDSCFLHIRCDHYFSAPGAEVALSYSADDALTWTESLACTSVYYRVATGSLGGLPVGSQPADERCIQVSATQIQDGVTPDPGEGFWYVVRGYRFNPIGPWEWHGSYGYARTSGVPGAERATPACP
jgi:hypothetical protein